MEDRVNLPLRGDVEAESCSRDDFLHFEWTGSFHLELLGPIHVEVGHFEPHFVSDFPGGEPRGYLFFHLLLSHLVGSVGARGYLCSQNCFLSIFRIPPVVMQAPIVSHVNPMLIQDLTIRT